MSVGELAWRCRGKVREALDRRMLKRRQRPIPWHCIVAMESEQLLTDRRVGGGHLRAVDLKTYQHETQAWRMQLLAEADRLIERRLRLFDLDHQ